MSSIGQLAWIAAGGAAGVVARYGLSAAITRAAGHGFPYATVLINVLGSLLIGIVYAATIETGALGRQAGLAVMIGVLGGFTTFSSFSLETVRMLEGGQWGLATLNAVLSVFLCLFATGAGLYLGRLTLPR